ncbi:MAG: ABC transporter permease subunit, partial [Candidatus Limnocylindrales bacterium]
MNQVIFRRTLAAYRTRFIICAVGITAWGLILPVIYATFGKSLADALKGNPFLSQFTQFGGGDLFTLSGAIAIGFIHPFSVALLAVFAVGFPIAAIAGERQRGTLEVLLARPVSRRSLYITDFLVGMLFLGLMLALELTANVVSSAAMGVLGEISVANMPILWLNGWLLFVAFMAVGFAASVSFDRVGPPLGITLAFLLIAYVIDVIASLWPDAKWIGEYSLFHYVKAKPV